MKTEKIIVSMYKRIDNSIFLKPIKAVNYYILVSANMIFASYNL